MYLPRTDEASQPSYPPHGVLQRAPTREPSAAGVPAGVKSSDAGTKHRRRRLSQALVLRGRQLPRGLATSMARVRIFAAMLGAILSAIAHTSLPLPLPLLLLFMRRRRREARLTRWHTMIAWARFCVRRLLGARLDVVGAEHLPRPSQGHLFIANHQSLLDIPLLMASLETVAFLSKRTVAYIPAIGLAAYGGGSVFLDRHKADSRKRALDEVVRMARESTGVIVFSEGTRSADGRISAKPRPGAIRRAHQEGLKIVPVGLHGTAAIIPKHADRFERGQPLAVTIGEPMDPAEWSDIDAWTTEVWRRVTALTHQSARRVAAAGGRA